jgi:hypothetical protein
MHTYMFVHIYCNSNLYHVRRTWTYDVRGRTTYVHVRRTCYHVRSTVRRSMPATHSRCTIPPAHHQRTTASSVWISRKQGRGQPRSTNPLRASSASSSTPCSRVDRHSSSWREPGTGTKVCAPSRAHSWFPHTPHTNTRLLANLSH